MDINLNPPCGDLRPRTIPEGFRSTGDLLKSNITQDWLIPDFLRRLQLVVIAGSPKTCKTISAQHIALVGEVE